MSSFAEHCLVSLEHFGRTYEEVHLWLDEFAGTKEFGYRHRRVRHHEEGIHRAAELFGADAAKVARQHIISDLRLEGWTEKDPFPRDEADYVRIGFF